jgi:hypothetical protein
MTYLFIYLSIRSIPQNVRAAQVNSSSQPQPKAVNNALYGYGGDDSRPLSYPSTIPDPRIDPSGITQYPRTYEVPYGPPPPYGTRMHPPIGESQHPRGAGQNWDGVSSSRYGGAGPNSIDNLHTTPQRSHYPPHPSMAAVQSPPMESSTDAELAWQYLDAYKTYLFQLVPVHPAGLHPSNVQSILCSSSSEAPPSILLTTHAVLALGTHTQHTYSVLLRHTKNKRKEKMIFGRLVMATERELLFN